MFYWVLSTICVLGIAALPQLKMRRVQFMVAFIVLLLGSLASAPAYAQYTILEGYGYDDVHNDSPSHGSSQSSTSSGNSQNNARGVEPGCDALPRVVIANNHAVADNIARANSTVLGTIGRYAADRSYACMQPLIKLVKDVYDKVNTIGNGFLPTVAAFVGVAAANILSGLLNQLIDNVVNAVCNASDQIYGFLRSGLENGICIKGLNGGINPFNFNINLEDFECSGFSVDLLNGGLKGNVVEGLSVDMSNYESQLEQAKAALRARQAAQSTPSNNAPSPTPGIVTNPTGTHSSPMSGIVGTP